MRAAAVVTGVLGAGSVLVFVVAGLVSTLFPSGTLVSTQWNGGCFDCGGWGKGGGIGVPVPMPMPVPVPGLDGVPEKGFVIDDGSTSVDVAPPIPAGTDHDVVDQP